MGTRHLTCVVADGEYRVAQYGQWDGYPAGQGVTILRFLRGAKIDVFREAVLECNFLGKRELSKVDALGDNWPKYYPELSRDAGADVLSMITFQGKRGLKNDLAFAGNSLFCEWAYVIDLDRGVLEVYRGFNKEPITDSDARFRSDDDTLEGYQKRRSGEAEYHPVKLYQTYELHELPTIDRLVSECDPDEDEED